MARGAAAARAGTRACHRADAAAAAAHWGVSSDRKVIFLELRNGAAQWCIAATNFLLALGVNQLHHRPDRPFWPQSEWSADNCANRYSIFFEEKNPRLTKHVF